MRKVSYLRWCPADSPMRIEFPPALLGELGGRQSWGVLYGTRHGAELRLLAARRQPDDSDPRLAAIAGLYFCRPRGDVFLTETDLERFLQSAAEVALVVCGKRAGFFLREPNGSIDSLRSYEEFTIPEVVATATSKAPPVLQAPRGRRERKWEWGWAAAAAAIVIAIPVGAMTYLRPLLPQPIQLSVAENHGQLVVSWNPRAPLAGGTLEIADGPRTMISTIRQGQHSATYTPQNEAVSVRVSTDTARMRYQSESAVRVMPLVATEPSAEVRALEAELSGLQAEVEEGFRQKSALERAIGTVVYRLRGR